jgi:hypothetical protein
LAAAGVGQSLLPPGAIAANTNGTGVSLAGKKGTAAAILNCGAATAGTNPTMDVKLQESDDNSTNWTDITGASFPQVTNAAKCNVISFRPGERKQYIRAVATIGGTSSPSFPVSCEILALPS